MPDRSPASPAAPELAADSAAASRASPTVAAANAAAASFAALTESLAYLGPAGVEQVRQAYRFADEAHLGQTRHSGEPVITHPIAVAVQCAAWRLDAQALMAALLHDAMEDCGVTKAELIARFGAPVAELVDGLTKVDELTRADKLPFNTREEKQAESFRKMLLAMARDMRVILIKLADRTHNMRTLAHMPLAKRARIATETQEVYAPIAHRLGLNQTYRELQDLAFRHLHPWRHATLAKAVSRFRSRSRKRDLVGQVQAGVAAAFAKIGLQVRLEGREKTLHSIYRKMVHERLGFTAVCDLYGFRVIVPAVLDCYTALGVLHQMYKPVPGKFRDHIAIAKLNGYQSLHTTLVGPGGVNMEFQLRTDAMHLVAEVGVAAHWLYKTQGAQGSDAERLGAQWLQSLLDIQNETRDAAEFWDHVKADLFPDAIYVFTPKGRIIALPRGATVIDFAYAIHSDVGDHTRAASINGEAAALRSELKNGDTVHAITAATARPSPAWLGFVRTGRARSRIRQHLRTLAQAEAQELGEKLLAQALPAQHGALAAAPLDAQPLWDKLLQFTGNRSRSELLADLGQGRRSAAIVARRLLALLAERDQQPDALRTTREHYSAQQSLAQDAMTLDGSENASVRYALCCRPLPGDAIVGYLGHGEGLEVHNAQCSVARRLQHKDSERFIAVDWSDEPTRLFETGVTLTIANGKGVLARVATVLARCEADITHVGMDEDPAQDSPELRFVIAVRDLAHLETALHNLRRTPAVLRAARRMPLS